MKDERPTASIAMAVEREKPELSMPAANTIAHSALLDHPAPIERQDLALCPFGGLVHANPQAISMRGLACVIVEHPEIRIGLGQIIQYLENRRCAFFWLGAKFTELATKARCCQAQYKSINAAKLTNLECNLVLTGLLWISRLKVLQHGMDIVSNRDC
jgi:hypothetical protein